MRKDLHTILHWLEGEISPEMRRASEQLDRAGQAAACRELLRKNSTAVGMRKQDVDKLDDEAVFEFAERLYQKYKYYIDRMERRSRGRL